MKYLVMLSVAVLAIAFAPIAPSAGAPPQKQGPRSTGVDRGHARHPKDHVLAPRHPSHRIRRELQRTSPLRFCLLGECARRPIKVCPASDCDPVPPRYCLVKDRCSTPIPGSRRALTRPPLEIPTQPSGQIEAQLQKLLGTRLLPKTSKEAANPLVHGLHLLDHQPVPGFEHGQLCPRDGRSYLLSGESGDHLVHPAPDHQSGHVYLR